MEKEVDGIKFIKGTNGKNDVRLCAVNTSTLRGYYSSDKNLRSTINQASGIWESCQALLNLSQESSNFAQRAIASIKNGDESQDFILSCEQFSKIIKELEIIEQCGNLEESQLQFLKKIRILRRSVLSKAIRQVKASSVFQ